MMTRPTDTAKGASPAAASAAMPGAPGSPAGATGAPGVHTYANNLDTDPHGALNPGSLGAAAKRMDKRVALSDLRSTVRKVTVHKRVWKCGHTVRRREGVGLAVDLSAAAGERIAGYRGLYSCASVWSCPRCSSVIGIERAAEIRRAAAKWRDEGAVIPVRKLLPVAGPLHWSDYELPSELPDENGELVPTGDTVPKQVDESLWIEPRRRLGRLSLPVPVRHAAGEVVFLTLTLRHTLADDLADLWDGLSKAFEGLTRGSRIFKDRVPAYTRSAEHTYSSRNGWHVHLHLALYVSKTFAQELTTMKGAVFAAWHKAVAKTGYSSTDDGQDMRLFCPEDADKLASYLNKNASDWDLAMELTGAAIKRASGASLTVRDMLAVLHADRTGKPTPGFDVAQVKGLYQVFEYASHGRRQLTWSACAREALAGEVIEDEELLEAAGDDDAVIENLDEGTPEVVGFSSSSWGKVSARRHGLQYVAETIRGDSLDPLADWITDTFTRTTEDGRVLVDVAFWLGEDWSKRLAGDRRGHEDDE